RSPSLPAPGSRTNRAGPRDRLWRCWSGGLTWSAMLPVRPKVRVRLEVREVGHRGRVAKVVIITFARPTPRPLGGCEACPALGRLGQVEPVAQPASGVLLTFGL